MKMHRLGKEADDENKDDINNYHEIPKKCKHNISPSFQVFKVEISVLREDPSNLILPLVNCYVTVVGN